MARHYTRAHHGARGLGRQLGGLAGRALLGIALVLMLVALVPGARAAAGPGGGVVLATTTSVQDTGLLDALLPVLERATGRRIVPLAVGTGQALRLAARGEADVVLSHAPELEARYVAEGRLANPRPLMTSDFVIVGPGADPARVRGAAGAADALARIVRARVPFVSRADESGTHQLEQALWRAAGIAPGGVWYVEAGQGMGATLGIAADRRAYALSDRGTVLAHGPRLGLPVLFEGDPALANRYTVLEAVPGAGPRVDTSGGRAVAGALVGAEARALIAGFGVRRFGRPLFIPAVGSATSRAGALAPQAVR